MDPYVGEIRMFAGMYAPNNWHFCDGSLVSINSYQLLYALVGTTWGGNGQTTFGLPDMRGRIPVGMGQGTGLTARVLAQTGGTSTVQIATANLPAHTHTLSASNKEATLAAVAPGVGLAQPVAPASGKVVRYSPPSPPPPVPAPTQQDFSQMSISVASGFGQAHPNVMPYLAIQYIICLNGLFPDRP